MGVDATAVASVLGIETQFADLGGGETFNLPQRIALIAQGTTAATYSTDKFQATSAPQVGDALGYGSPAHLAAKQFFPQNGDGIGTIPLTVYPLVDDAAGIAASGDITPAGTHSGKAAYRVRVNNILSEAFTLEDGETVADATAKIAAAINAVASMPVTAVDNTTDVGLTSKWKGASANAIFVEIVGDTSNGVTFTITQPTGGDVNPDVQTALDQIGNVWETLVLNPMEFDDETTLDKLQTFGDGRWGELVRKPLVAFVGCTRSPWPTPSR